MEDCKNYLYIKNCIPQEKGRPSFLPTPNIIAMGLNLIFRNMKSFRKMTQFIKTFWGVWCTLPVTAKMKFTFLGFMYPGNSVTSVKKNHFSFFIISSQVGPMRDYCFGKWDSNCTLHWEHQPKTTRGRQIYMSAHLCGLECNVHN